MRLGEWSNIERIVLEGAVHPKDNKALIFIFVIHFFDGGHFGFAGRAPGSPYIDENRLPFKVRQGIDFAFGGVEGEIGREEARLRRGTSCTGVAALCRKDDPGCARNEDKGIENDSLGLVHVDLEVK